jgi:hypothetical protein
MKNWFNKNYKTIIISAFLIPIIIVAFVSISHVTVWYDISNPDNWAAYLSIGIEIAALSALAAISANMGRKVYFPFVIVTLIQFIGNIFFAYQFIDINGKLFRSWVELVAPLLSTMGVEETDFIGHKRFLALFSGGLLPLISLSFLHMLVKFSEENKAKSVETQPIINSGEQPQTIASTDLMAEVSKVNLSEEDIKKLEEILMKPPAPNETLKSAADEYKNIVNQEENIQETSDSEMISNDLYQESEDENLIDDNQGEIDEELLEIIEPITESVSEAVENEVEIETTQSDDKSESEEIVEETHQPIDDLPKEIVNDVSVEPKKPFEINNSFYRQLEEKKNSESQTI